jgi:hypothetical protein
VSGWRIDVFAAIDLAGDFLSRESIAVVTTTA